MIGKEWTSSCRPALLLLACLTACGDDASTPPTGISIGGPDGTAAIEHVAVTDGGDLVVGGKFEGTLAFGALPPITSVMQADGFVARLAPDGTVAWARGFGGLPANLNRDDEVTGVATFPDGSVVVTGYVEGTIDLGGGPLEEGPGGGRGTLFVARYAADGAHLWSQRWQSGSGESRASAPTIGADGSIYVTASFTARAHIGSLELNFGTHSERVLVALDPAGAVRWARPLRTRAPIEPSVGTYNASAPLVIGSDVYVTGTVYGVVDLGPTDAGDLGPIGEAELDSSYVLKFGAAAGSRAALSAYGALEAPHYPRAIIAAPDGDLVLVGPHVVRLASDLSIASSLDLSALTHDDAYDGHAAFLSTGELVWIAKFAYVRIGADGIERARETFPFGGAVVLRDVAVDADDQVHVVGGYAAAFTLATQSFADPAGRTRGFVTTTP